MQYETQLASNYFETLTPHIIFTIAIWTFILLVLLWFFIRSAVISGIKKANEETKTKELTQKTIE